VFLGEAVTANLTVIGPTGNGYLTPWSGIGSRPNASSINFTNGQAALSNLTVSVLAEIVIAATTFTNTTAIFAAATTFVLFDAAGFGVGSFGQVLVPPLPALEARSDRVYQSAGEAPGTSSDSGPYASAE